MKQLFKTCFVLVLVLANCYSAAAQEPFRTVTGQVSFVSSQHVYVKFKNTEGIYNGDTLFVENNGAPVPALLVSGLSSISCVTVSLNKTILAVGSPVIARIPVLHKPVPEVEIEKSKESVAVVSEVIGQIQNGEKKTKPKTEFPVEGRVSVSSYTNVDAGNSSYQRFRYNVALRADSISRSGLSAETQLSFIHKLNEPVFLSDAFKVYTLNLKYDSKTLGSFVLGRKINPFLANAGAVDGLQYEKQIRNFTVGAVAGMRPDIYDYGFNPTLFQYGAFAAHNFRNGKARTTLAFMNQTNNMITDRRFAYFQHSNSLVKKVSLFCSFEVDLYSLQNNTASISPELTGAYFSVRYKALKNLAFTLNYDARKNIYYYETYKNVADSILDRETRQGLRFQTIYRPFGDLTWGMVAGVRFAGANTTFSSNANTYLSYDNLPLVGGTIRADVTLLRTHSLAGWISGASYSRDFLKNKLYAELGYRYVNYDYTNSGSLLNQHIAEFSLIWRITRRLMLSANLETIADSNNALNNRLFLNLSQRF